MLGHDRRIADRPKLVDVGRLALEAALDAPFARVVVLVALRATVVGDLLDAVFLVPDDGPPRAVLRVLPAQLVAVGIVGEGPLTYLNHCSKLPFLLSFSLVYFLRTAVVRSPCSESQLPAQTADTGLPPFRPTLAWSIEISKHLHCRFGHGLHKAQVTY